MLEDPMYVKTQVWGNQDGQAIADDENHDFYKVPLCVPHAPRRTRTKMTDNAPGEGREGGRGQSTPTALIPATRTPETEFHF